MPDSSLFVVDEQTLLKSSTNLHCVLLAHASRAQPAHRYRLSQRSLATHCYCGNRGGRSGNSNVSVTFRFWVSIHPSLVSAVNIQLSIHSLDISSSSFKFAVEKSDLGGDDCEEVESKSSAQLMSDTSDSGDVDSMGYLASRDSGNSVEWRQWAGRRTADSRPAAFLA